MSSVSFAQPDISLSLDAGGVIREASLSNGISGEVVQAWLGRPWMETVDDGNSVRRIVEDARTIGVSAFRHVTQRFPSGLELPIEYTTVRLGGKAGLIAVGKNLQAVAELQSRLVAAQHAREQDYWKLREIETRSRLLFDASSEAVLLVDAETLSIIEANPAAIRLLGLAPGWSFGREIAPLERDAFDGLLQRARAQGRAPGIVVHLGAERVAWTVRASLMTTNPGPIYLLQIVPIGTVPDKPRDQRAQLPLDDLVSRLPDGFVVLDVRGAIRSANHAFLDLVQVSVERAVIGESLGRWLSQPGANLDLLLSNLRRHGTVRNFATVVQGELGTEAEVNIAAAIQTDVEPAFIALLVRDVSRRARSSEQAGQLHETLAVIAEQIGRTSLPDLVKSTASVMERHCIEVALRQSGGNRTVASEMLGLSRQSLYVKLNRYGLEEAPLAEPDLEQS